MREWGGDGIEKIQLFLKSQLLLFFHSMQARLPSLSQTHTHTLTGRSTQCNIVLSCERNMKESIFHSCYQMGIVSTLHIKGGSHVQIRQNLSLVASPAHPFLSLSSSSAFPHPLSLLFFTVCPGVMFYSPLWSLTQWTLRANSWLCVHFLVHIPIWPEWCTMKQAWHSQTLFVLAGLTKAKTPVRVSGCNDRGYQLSLLTIFSPKTECNSREPVINSWTLSLITLV